MNASAAKTVVHVSSIDHALRRQTREFVAGWRELVAQEWNADRAGVLHEEVEHLAAAAEAKRAAEVADPALEMTVYLCSFVDEGVRPDAAQQRELQSLVDALAATCGMAPALPGAHTSVPEHKHWQALYLRDSADDLPGLAAQMGQRGFIVRVCKDPRHLLLTLDTLSPDLMLVDEAFVSELHSLTAAVERRRPPHKDPALCVLLAQEADQVRGLFAQRAGASAVITDRDPIAIAARLDELLARRNGLGYRVLVVEDDRGQAKFCESILRHRGMITSVCDTADRAPAMVAEFRPDLVLLDLYLADRNGIEVAQKIRAQSGTAYLPIVFLSGEHDLDLRFDAISVGADDFITKPVKPRHLITSVESRVRRARELSAAQPAERGERRGHLSGRETFAREVLRVANEEQERCPTLALIGVDAPERVGRDAGFVAAGALAQQIAAALAAEIKGMRVLCAYGELRCLVLRCPNDEAAARSEHESLRAMLDSRVWGSAEAPLRLRFSVACLRLDAETDTVEKWLERLQALSAQAREAGGARCLFDMSLPLVAADEDPQQRQLRALLGTHSLADAARFSFQPIVQLAGYLTGQYAARMSLVPSKLAELSVDDAQYLQLARGLNQLAQAERLYLRALLELIRAREAGKRNLRIHLPISVSTALDPTFAPWLAAELGGHSVSAGFLVLRLSGEHVHARLTQARPLLESLQRLGLRLGVDLCDEGRKVIHELLQLDSINVVNFRRPEGADAQWSERAALVSEARSLGKTVLASGVQNMDELGVVLRLGAHYVQADLLAGWSADWNFEFVAIA